MPRKRRGIPPLEDVSDRLFQFPCPHCGEKFEKSGAWFQNANYFICPACKYYVSLPDEEVTRMISKHIKSLKEAIARLEAEATKKSD